MQRSTTLLAALVLLLLAITAATRLSYRIDSRSLPARPTGFTLDLNTADADTLAILPAVGPALARRIIDYRAAHGPFRQVADLRSVSGVGDKTLQRLLPFVSCESAR